MVRPSKDVEQLSSDKRRIRRTVLFVLIAGFMLLVVTSLVCWRDVRRCYHNFRIRLCYSEITGSLLDGLKENSLQFEDRGRRYFVRKSNEAARETIAELVRLGKDATPILLVALQSADLETRQTARQVLPLVTGVEFGPNPVSYEVARDPEVWGRVVSDYKRWWNENEDRRRMEWILAAIESGEGSRAFTSWMGAFSWTLEVSGIQELGKKLDPVLAPLAPEYALTGSFPKALWVAVHDSERRREIAEIARRTVEELRIGDL